MKPLAGGIMMITLLGLAALASCSGSTPSFEDTTWVLTDYGPAGDLTPAVADVEVTIYFHSEKYEISGSTGCNTYNGTYLLEGDHVTIKQVAVTERSCGQALAAQEQQFLEILRNTQQYTLAEDAFVLLDGTNELDFQKQ